MSFLKNKYFIATALFGILLLFFDKNDFFTQRSRSRELQMLEKSKAHYQDEIAKERKELEQLRNDSAALERYAREKYGMKKDDEDLFIIQEESKEKK